MLADTDARRALEVAERMRAGVEAAPLAAIAERATISIGVATQLSVTDIAAAWEALLTEADAHLYRAKSAGRNRVVARENPRTDPPVSAQSRGDAVSRGEPSASRSDPRPSVV